jgi:hypothetical protein
MQSIKEHEEEKIFLETEISRLQLENTKLKESKKVLWKMLVEFMDEAFDGRTANK